MTLHETISNLSKRIREAYSPPLISLAFSCLALMDDVLLSEWMPHPAQVLTPEPDTYITCDYCGSDIFCHFFQCSSCIRGSDPITICPLCCASGRGCKCISGMRACSIVTFDSLVKPRNGLALLLSNKSNQDLGILKPWAHEYAMSLLRSSSRDY